MNHPTFCMRKSKILEVGNYNSEIHTTCEDFELILRVLKKFGTIHNMNETLLYYRIHDEQVTHGGGKEGAAFWSQRRNTMIEKMLKSDENTNSTNEVTMVITSCNRPNELTKTLKSFLKYNTYPIKKIIIIDDSGKKGCIDDCLCVMPSNVKYEIIYIPENIGQISSIDKAYSLIDTEYIFHCEDDWEFYDYGFIEKSIEILLQNSKIFTIWLREYVNSKVIESGHTIESQIYDNSYRLLGVFKERTNIWSGFTFNPGLRRLKDCKLLMPYSQYIGSSECNCGGVEQALSNLYYKNGFRCATTLNNNGYVKHIGWDNPTVREYS